MNRILNSKSHLENLLKDGDKYSIGFGVKTLTTEGLVNRDLLELIKGKLDDVLIMGKKGPLKENMSGSGLESNQAARLAKKYI
jgi:hypothetical protein